MSALASRGREDRLLNAGMALNDLANQHRCDGDRRKKYAPPGAPPPQKYAPPGAPPPQTAVVVAAKNTCDTHTLQLGTGTPETM